MRMVYETYSQSEGRRVLLLEVNEQEAWDLLFACQEQAHRAEQADRDRWEEDTAPIGPGPQLRQRRRRRTRMGHVYERLHDAIAEMLGVTPLRPRVPSRGSHPVPLRPGTRTDGVPPEAEDELG
jgi:hypothetical protein